MLFAVSCAARADVPRAEVTIDPSESLGPVNPMIFGQNIEAGDGTGIFQSGLQPHVIETGTGVWDARAEKPDSTISDLVKPLAVGSLRYPGGCLVHGFDWKTTIGPREQRAEGWHFGLDEFLALCKAWNTAPVITVSDYTGTPQDAADLVEYLNAPADADHPWAMRRAANGHPSPYGVVWFELGNESVHGNHDMQPPRCFSPSDYADYFLATGEAMRRVDSSVRLGLVLVPGIDVQAQWNRRVLEQAGSQADFAVVHFYAPDERPAPGGVFNRGELMRACMAAGAQYERLVDEYHELIRQFAGRELPLAVTEYNIGVHVHDGYAYRFTHAGALMSADLIRVMLPERRGVQMAHYWGLVNGYWGMIHRPAGHDAVTLRPAYPMFRLWGAHFGGAGGPLVSVNVNGPTLDFGGYYKLRPAHGDAYEPLRVRQTINVLGLGNFGAMATWKGVNVVTADDAHVNILMNDVDTNRYASIATIRADTAERMDYRLTFEARFDGQVEGTANLGVGIGDDRGWSATKHAVAAMGAADAAQWQPFSCLLRSLPNMQGVEVVVRLEGKGGRITGTLHLRNVTLELLAQETLPAYQAVTAAARLGTDGSSLPVMLFNKSLEETIEVQLNITGRRVAAGQFQQIAADDPASLTPAVVDPLPQPLRVTEDGLAQLSLPPASMTAAQLQLEDR